MFAGYCIYGWRRQLYWISEFGWLFKGKFLIEQLYFNDLTLSVYLQSKTTKVGSKRIIYGCSELMNADQFLKQLSALGWEELAFIIHHYNEIYFWERIIQYRFILLYTNTDRRCVHMRLKMFWWLKNKLVAGQTVCWLFSGDTRERSGIRLLSS